MTDGRPDLDEVFRERTDAPNPIWHVLRVYGGSYRRRLVGGLLTAATLPLLDLVQPYLLGVVVDVVTGSSYRLPFIPDAWLPTRLREQLLMTFGLLVATFVVRSLVESVDSLTWSRLRHDLEHDLRVDAYDAAQRLGMDFFTQMETGDVMNVLNDDMQELHGAVDWGKEVYQLAVFGGGMAVLMLAMNWPLAVVVLFVGVPLGVITYVFQGRVVPKYTRVRRAAGQFNARLESAISGIAAVKANTNEAIERQRVSAGSQEYRDSSIAVSRLWAVFVIFNRMFLQGSTLVVALFGGWIVLRGPPTSLFSPLTAGAFVTFFFYARQFTDRMQDFGRTVNVYERIAASGRRVFGLIHYPAAIDDLSTEDPVVDVAGHVEYDSVSFQYPGADEPVLQDVSFEVEPGTFVGIVGPTGAGKTTLLKLLVRFYDPDAGTIRLDGERIRELPVTQLRQSIGYIAQEPFLFDDTVRDNIAYATRDASKTEIEAAAKRARAHEFITELDDGYDTEVGERGVKLSGGQRQRIVIARELLRDPDILILDEATSHVDNQTEALIQDFFEELVTNRTTFAIAHRLSTVRDADQVLVLEDGSITERGTHDDLLEADGFYATLWKIHIGESNEVPEEVFSGRA